MCVELLNTDMRASFSIAKWFPKNDFGDYLSINSVYTKIEGTENEVGRHTLRTALNGQLDRIHADNLVKLSRLCSLWSGTKVSIDDLLVIEND